MRRTMTPAALFFWGFFRPQEGSGGVCGCSPHKPANVGRATVATHAKLRKTSAQRAVGALHPAAHCAAGGAARAAGGTARAAGGTAPSCQGRCSARSTPYSALSVSLMLCNGVCVGVLRLQIGPRAWSSRVCSFLPTFPLYHASPHPRRGMI